MSLLFLTPLTSTSLCKYLNLLFSFPLEWEMQPISNDLGIQQNILPEKTSNRVQMVRSVSFIHKKILIFLLVNIGISIQHEH